MVQYSHCFIWQADVTALPFEDHSSELITAVETVYFWPEIKKGLCEIRRASNPSGAFAILNGGSDPDKTSRRLTAL